MICDSCKQAADWNTSALHLNCEGKTQCDCQHKPVGTGIQKEQNSGA